MSPQQKVRCLVLHKGKFQTSRTAFCQRKIFDLKSSFPFSVSRNPLVSIREGLLTQVFGQVWEKKCHEIKQASPFGTTKGWRLASFIMKAGEDIRREALVMQIIVKLNEWFQGEIPQDIRPHLRPYTIMCVGGDAGLVECLNDAKSIDEVKKRTDSFQSLRDFFERAYDSPGANNLNNEYSGNGEKRKTLTFTEAQDNFLRSIVGYSLVCYILQIKDRHNANILLDREGNVIHIDFGFVLGDTPKMGKVPIFSERAPFKLSGEFWDVLGGCNVQQCGLGVRFCNMFEHAFASAASHAEDIVSLVEATMLTLTQNPRQARIIANGIRSRLRMRGQPGSREQNAFVMELVNAALTSWGTSTYDWLQKNMNGYQ
jgi:phosphatidylinositol 4-kinase